MQSLTETTSMQNIHRVSSILTARSNQKLYNTCMSIELKQFGNDRYWTYEPDFRNSKLRYELLFTVDNMTPEEYVVQVFTKKPLRYRKENDIWEDEPEYDVQFGSMEEALKFIEEYVRDNSLLL